MIKHYYYFGESNGLVGNSLDEQNWDVLRVKGGIKDFALEKTGEEWELNCRSNESNKRRAERAVHSVSCKYRNWVSFGIGKGILEWNVKNIEPGISIRGTDYAEASLSVLEVYANGMFNVGRFNLLSFDDYDELNVYDVALLGRISTEFDKKNWGRIFDKLYETSIKEIVFIPTEILNLKIVMNELFSHASHLISGKKGFF